MKPGYDTWLLSAFPNPADRANPAISGPSANPSGDGVTNLLRYALGVGPHDPITTQLPTLVKNGGTYDFSFLYDPAKTDLVWRVTATSNLIAWTNVLFDSTTSPIPPLVAGRLPVTLPPYLGTGPDPDPRIFARLEVRLAP